MKYKLLKETKKVNGSVVYRIESLQNFDGIKIRLSEKLNDLMLNGVTIIDPSNTYFGPVKLQRDGSIWEVVSDFRTYKKGGE